MKTLRLNDGIESIVLNEKKFQIWAGNKIIQIRNGIYHKIFDSRNFIWATNFVSFDEAKRHAEIIIKMEKRSSGVKIFSGNLLYAEYKESSWVIYDEPVGQLL